MVVVIGVVLEAHQRLRKLIMLFVKGDEIYEEKTNVFVRESFGANENGDEAVHWRFQLQNLYQLTGFISAQLYFQ